MNPIEKSQTPPWTAHLHNAAANLSLLQTPSSLMLSPLIAGHVDFIHAQKVAELARGMALKFSIPFNASSLSVECALHTAELELILDPTRRALIEKRLDAINARGKELNLPKELFTYARETGRSLAGRFRSSVLSDSPQNIFQNVVVEALGAEISKQQESIATVVSNVLDAKYSDLDLCRYGIGDRRTVLSSRGGSERSITGRIDCSHFTWIQKRELLSNVLRHRGMSESVIGYAVGRLPYRPTKDLFNHAYKPQAFHLSTQSTSLDIMKLVREGKLRDGFEIVFPPSHGGRYGHVVMLRVAPNRSDAWFEESTVSVSRSERNNSTRQNGVQRFELSRFDNLLHRAGTFRIFIDPTLREHGIWPGI